MAPRIGVNLRVTGHCNQGGRKYMEDVFVVAYQPTEYEKDLEYAYFAIFDGHGGRDAALFAKEHLMDSIVRQKNFWSDSDELVTKAIKDGFVATHMAMWKEVGNWPKTSSGLPSTSGTTASIAFIRNGKIYIGHVGDSKIVLGYQNPDSDRWLPRPLTEDHKPETPAERERIYNVGGCVMNKGGVERVVWYRPRVDHKGPVRRSTHVDQIPFLAVARSLGDLWSYNYYEGEFIVSPEPDVHVIPLDPKRDHCLILASDGLWNMLSLSDAVRLVQDAERESEREILESDQKVLQGKAAKNPSKLLVDYALSRWSRLNMRADNTSVVTVLLDPPGPSKREVLLRQKVMKKLRPREDQAEDNNSFESEAMDTSRSSPDTEAGSKADGAAKDRRRSVATTVLLPKPVILTPRRIMVKRAISVVSATCKQYNGVFCGNYPCMKPDCKAIYCSGVRKLVELTKRCSHGESKQSVAPSRVLVANENRSSFLKEEPAESESRDNASDNCVESARAKRKWTSSASPDCDINDINPDKKKSVTRSHSWTNVGSCRPSLTRNMQMIQCTRSRLRKAKA